MSAFGAVLLAILTTFLLIATAAVYLGIDGFSLEYEQTEAPTTTFAFDYVENPAGNESVVVRHVEGDQVNPEQLRVEVSGATCSRESDPNGAYNGYEDFGFGEENWLAPGNSIAVDSDSPGQLCPGGRLGFEEATLDVVWENPSGPNVTLASWEAADGSE